MGRPLVMDGVTYKIRTDSGTIYITVNFDKDGKPKEVFLTIGKSGSVVNGLAEALGRVISIALQHGISPQTIIKQLKDIASPTDGGYSSIPDAVAKALHNCLGGRLT